MKRYNCADKGEENNHYDGKEQKAMAEALYGVPDELSKTALEYLPAEMQGVVAMFRNEYMSNDGSSWAMIQADLQEKGLQKRQ